MADKNPLRYRGYYYDAETGFYYLQSRYYDPTNRRFINADSYSSTGQGFVGTNMFAYCGGNPVNRSDASGCFWEEYWEALREALQQAEGAFATAGSVALMDSPAPGPADLMGAGIAGVAFLGCVFEAFADTVSAPS